MPRLETASVPSDPTTLLRAWIVLGLLSLCFVPWQIAYVGWLPYWLVVAPAISLCLLNRRRLAAVWQARQRRRRRPCALRVARV